MPSISISSKDMLKWAEDYSSHLSVLKRDLELYFDPSKKIFIAIDFKDLVDHSFPNLQIFGNISPIYDAERTKVITSALTRYWLLELKSLYNENKIIILPPYMAEAFDFFNNFSHRISEIIRESDENKKIFINALYRDLDNIKPDSFNEPGASLPSGQLESKASYLALLFTPGFEGGVKTLKSLLKNKLVTSLEDISNYDNMIYKSFLVDCTMIRRTLDKLRSDRIMQNYKDARAIQYTKDINEDIGKSEIFLLISSSKIFEDYLKDIAYEDIHQKLINGRKYPLIRSLATFEVALIELCDFIGINLAVHCEFQDIPEIEFEKIDYKMFYSKVEYDLEVINKFIKMRKGEIECKDGGILKEYVENEISENFIKFIQLIKQREKTDLMIMMKKMSKDPEKLNNLEKYVDNRKEIIQAIKDIIKELVEPKVFHLILKNKMKNIVSEERDLLSGLNHNYISLSIGDRQLEKPIFYFGKWMGDILEDRSVIELVNKFNENKLEYPEDPSLLRLTKDL